MADFSVAEIFKTIEEMAPQYGIDPTTAKSLIVAENTKDGRIRKATFSGSATNENNTMGIGQVIPSTARGLQGAGLLPADWTFDPKNLRSQLSASLATMKDMSSRLKDPNDPLELGSYYNGGTAAWKAYQRGEALNPETTQYLQKQRTFMADNNLTPQQIERNVKTASPGTTSSNSRSGSSFSTFDPASLDAFNQAAGILQGSGGLFDQAYSAITDRGGQLATAGTDVMQSIIQAGQDAGAAAQARATLEAAGQARRAAILTKANLHPEQAMNRADQALAALDTTSAALDQLRPEIDARTSVGFFDNPLEWIVNQTRLPGMVSNYNNLVTVQQDQLTRYQAAADIAKSSIDMSQAIDADATLAAGNAMAKAAASEAAAKSKQIQLQLAGKAAADALAAVQLGTQNAALSYQQLMLTRQKQFEQEGLSEKEAARKADEAILQDLNTVVKAAGGAGIDLARFKSLPAADRAELMKSVSTKKFGGDFASAYQFVKEYGSFDNMAVGGQAAVRTWVNDTLRAASGETIKAQTDAENPASPKYNKKFNAQTEMKEQMNAAASRFGYAANVDMRNQPDYNPFKIDYKTIAKTPAFQANVWAQQIAKYGPGGTEQQFENVDEQQFMNKALMAINLSGDPQTAVKKYAADISQFYREASKIQRSNTKPELFGLPLPEKTYPVVFPNYATGTKVAPVDLGDPTQVENLLTRQIAKMKATEAAKQFGYTSSRDQGPPVMGTTGIFRN